LPDPHTGKIRVKATVQNVGEKTAEGHLLLTAAPAMSGETIAMLEVANSFQPGSNLVEATLSIENPLRWDLNSPNLYRVSARVATASSASWDEYSTRCGFREFKFENGYFRLNGHRVFLRCSHTGADTPVGVEVPGDSDLVRRDPAIIYSAHDLRTAGLVCVPATLLLYYASADDRA
jgi:hypothetical protein